MGLPYPRPMRSFNRTIVELKHVRLTFLFHFPLPFNRTIVELKQHRGSMAHRTIKEGSDKMGEQEQYRIVEVDDPVYGSRYVVQYAHRTFFRNRLVWKDLFTNRSGEAGDIIFFSFLMAKEALEKHIDEENYGGSGEEGSNPDVTPEHEDFNDSGDIDF